MAQNSIDTIIMVYDQLLNDATVSDEHVRQIRKAAPEAKLTIIRNQEEWIKLKAKIAPKVQVLFARRPAGWFPQLPNLRWIQQTGAGADWLLQVPRIVESDIILTNTSGSHAVPISEHVLALMLSLSRGIGRHIKNQVKHVWDRQGRVFELDGATVGLIGVGRIGEKIAEKAKCLNMRILGLRRHPERTAPYVSRMYGSEGLMELLALSDWVVIAAALTSETKGMIGEAELKTMKQSAFIINIARGPLIVEHALIDALQQDRIAGAGLDVFENEPLAPDSPLWDMDNVVITPHASNFTPHKVKRQIAIFTENLQRYLNGHPLLNVVDKHLGY